MQYNRPLRRLCHGRDTPATAAATPFALRRPFQARRAYREISLLPARRRDAKPSRATLLPHSRLLDAPPNSAMRRAPARSRPCRSSRPRRRHLGLHSHQRHLDHRRLTTQGGPVQLHVRPPWTWAFGERVGGRRRSRPCVRCGRPASELASTASGRLRAVRLDSTMPASTVEPWRRLTEILKQAQYQPLPVEKQILISSPRQRYRTTGPWKNAAL